MEELLVNTNSNKPLLEETLTMGEYNYWISLKYKRNKIVSLFFTKGVMTDALLKLQDGWEEFELTEEEKKRIDEFIERKENGNVHYKPVRGVTLLRFEEFSENSMIEYNMSGNKIYEGECEGDIGDGFYRSGHGREYINGELVYDGKWEKNQRHGQGKYYSQGEVYYEGKWKKGVRSGYGKCYLDDEEYYEGEWKNDQPNGQGQRFMNGECYFKGEWKNGKPNGYGEAYAENGDVYKGNWKDGYLQVGEKCISFQLVEYKGIPGINWICALFAIGVFCIFGGPFVNMSMSVVDNVSSFYVSIGCFDLIITSCLLLPYFWSLDVTIGFTGVFGLYILWQMLMEVQCVVSSVFMLLALCSLVISIVALCIKGKSPNYKHTNLFSYIDKKNAYVCIIIELSIAFLLTFTYYKYFWHSVIVKVIVKHGYTIRKYSSIILINGFIYACLAFFHCFENPVFTIANIVGCIWGVFSTYKFHKLRKFSWYEWDKQNMCPSYDLFIIPCKQLRALSHLIQLFTWFCFVTSLVLFYQNRKCNKTTIQNTTVNSQV